MNKEVRVYSTPECPYCIALRKFLNEHNVFFENFDVSSDHQKAEEMIEKSGQMGVPVLDIDGEIIVGFDREKIKSSLGL